ncbi:MAG: response regulator [Myxococcota bacterium]
MDSSSSDLLNFVGASAPAILFVDDDVPNLKVIDVHLRSDFNVLTAQNGTDALAMLQSAEHDIGLVVADQRMSGMTGVELLTIIRNDYPNVGRMLITAFADLEPVIAAINEGQISGYIRKPWNPTDIRLLLRSGLKQVLLERRLRQAEIELLRSERDAVIGFVASGVGHDLNQPASVLRMNLEMLRDGLDSVAKGDRSEDVLEDAAAVLQDCLQAVDDLALLSADLRVIASAGRKEADTTNVNAAAQRALRFADAHLRHIADLNIELDELPDVRAEESSLTQVIVSVLSHSLHYLEKATTNARSLVTVQSEMIGRKVVLRVRDDGPGIPPEDLETVFEPFVFDEQHGAKSRVGLALAKTTVESWKGSLDVQSSIDVGSVYEIHLLPSPAVLSVVREAPSEQRALPTVLVVDDEPSVLRAVQRILRDNFEVVTAESGNAALDKLASEDFGAVLCDLQMPLPDGADIYRRIKQSKPHMASHFAFMTGGALSSRATAFLDEAEQMGIVVLNKPFDHRRVRSIVLELVSKGV